MAGVLEKLGKYEIRLQIGRGAMGTVYEGFDPTIGRRVAIKTLRTEMFEQHQLPEVLVRFKREAQSAGRLSHPHIVTIYEYGEEAGTPYIVMEYINGKELGHELDRGVRFRLEDVVRLMTQLLGALAHAHENGVVHRDLKPANMFVLEDGSLKVVDFGIARLESSNLTETGAMLGTPAYMSPEQIMALPVDHRSDLFSAGVILYQLLTGDKPFTGSVTSVMQKVLKQDALPPSELNPTLSAAWDAVISRAMAKKPETRYATARQFAEAIKLAQQAERVHEEESRRKADETREHALRETQRNSREEAKRREEAALAEIAWKEREEQAHRTVALPSGAIGATPRASWARPVATGALMTSLVVAALWGFLAYQRGESARQAAKTEASRASDELAKQADAASKQRAEQEAAAARKAQDAKKEAERLTQAQAAELARREAEEKAQNEARHKQDEAKRKAELAAKAAAAQREKVAEERAKAEKARLEEETKAKADLAAAQARTELIKAEAARKAKEASDAALKTALVKRDGYDGRWDGTFYCGAPLSGFRSSEFTLPVIMMVDKNGRSTIERRGTAFQGTQVEVRLSGLVDKEGGLALSGEGRDNASAWQIKFRGKVSGQYFEAKGELETSGVNSRECRIFLQRTD